MICIFKCPGCNGNMTFDIEKQMLVCQSCGTEIDAEDYDEKQIVFEGGQEYGEDIISYRCPTCSAEVEVDSSQATCTCSYCGIEMAVFAGENGRMAPEKIIPFELDQAAAEVAFCKWWLDHDTMPKFNRKQMKFAIRPMYLPVWLVNANTKTDMSAVVKREEMIGGTYSYSGTQNHSWDMQQDNLTFSDRDKRTRNYLIRKSLYTKFFKVPSNASYHFSSTRFFGIEPYNYMKLEDFAPGYISGLPAEHYSIEASDVIPRALKRIKGFGVEQCKTYILGSHTGESKIVEEAGCIQSIELKQIIYAMVPVWICSYTFMGKKHMVYVNGQTGKADGEVVSSKERLKSYAVTLFLSTYFEYFVLLLFMLSMHGLKPGEVVEIWVIFFAFFVGSLTGNLPKKLTRKRNGKKETVELYADIEYVKKDFVKPIYIAIRRMVIGILFLPIALAYSNSSRLSAPSSHMLESVLFAFVLSAVWTTLFLGLPKKLTRKRNGKKETVELYADIEYVKKDFVKPIYIAIRRMVIGILFLPIALAYSNSSRLSAPSSHMLESVLFAFVLSAVWTTLFLGIHVRKEKEQKPAEYNDYLNMSITDILESSEHVY